MRRERNGRPQAERGPSHRHLTDAGFFTSGEVAVFSQVRMLTNSSAAKPAAPSRVNAAPSRWNNGIRYW